MICNPLSVIGTARAIHSFLLNNDSFIYPVTFLSQKFEGHNKKPLIYHKDVIFIFFALKIWDLSIVKKLKRKSYSTCS
jgi:hypothetical protein